MEVDELLLLETAQVAKRLGIPTTVAAARQRAASQGLLGPRYLPVSFTNSGEPPHCQKFLLTGDTFLDRVLGGRGIPSHHITEVHGPASSGKTQLMLQLLVQALLPPWSSPGVAYLCTEAHFPLGRFEQILRIRLPACRANYQELGEEEAAINKYMSRVHILQIRDLETLEHILSYQLPALVQAQGIRLVILDSIAANFRGGGDEFMHGNAVFGGVAKTLVDDVDDADETGAEREDTPATTTSSASMRSNASRPREGDARNTRGAPRRPTLATKEAERASQSAFQRSHFLQRLGVLLKRVAGMHGCAVVCTNQISEVFERQEWTCLSNTTGTTGGGALMAGVRPPVKRVSNWIADPFLPCLGIFLLVSCL
jgi:hypothetical protein